MPLRKTLLAVALLLATPSLSAADPMALVYESESAVKEGRSWPAPVTAIGVVVPAATAMPAIGTLLIGDGEGLFRAVLFRLDNDLNAALLRKGERVEDQELSGLNATRWAASVAFLGGSGVEPAGAAPAFTAASSTEPFRASINGITADQPVKLTEKFNKAKFKLQVVNVSTSPVWTMSVRLTSDPKLSFWKAGRRAGLNEIPEPVLEYEKQSLLRPIRPGESITVSAEAYFIKDKDYTWTVESRSKNLSGSSTFAVRIE